MDAIFNEEMPRARLAVLLEHFSQIDDDREPRRVVYPLAEILLLLTCATIASCDGRIETRTYTASSKVDWTVSDRNYPGEARFTHIKTIVKIDLLTEYPDQSTTFRHPSLHLVGSSRYRPARQRSPWSLGRGEHALVACGSGPGPPEPMGAPTS
jgi:hypothetical protein